MELLLYDLRLKASLISASIPRLIEGTQFCFCELRAHDSFTQVWLHLHTQVIVMCS